MRRAIFFAENAIYEVEELEANDIAVYVLLCRQAEGKDGRSKQSVALLARRARLSERAVRYALEVLAKRRIVEIRKGGGRKMVSVYRVRPSTEWAKTDETVQEVQGFGGNTLHQTTGNPAPGDRETLHLVPAEGRTAVRDVLPEGYKHPAAVAAASVLPSGFMELWNRYPKQEGKAKAIKAYQKLNPSPDVQRQIMAGLEVWRVSERWAAGWVMELARWLTEHRWEDSPAPDRPRLDPQTEGAMRRFLERGRAAGENGTPTEWVDGDGVIEATS